MNNEWFLVKDLEELINSTRALIFNNFGKRDEDKDSIDDILATTINEQDKKELNDILSYDESLVIVKSLIKKQFNKKSRKTRYVMTEKIFIEIIESLNDRMVSNMLNGLVNRGMVETAYDSESDDFIFWIKDDVKKQIEKPEADRN
jgi:hypothetical protein